ncbi:MAG: acyltransferase [Anaerorhabdus sp.]
MTTLSRKKEFNSSVELLRIICTLMVIGIHTLMNFRTTSNFVNYDVLFMESFLRSCVPIFFMISGFFLLKSNSTTKQLFKRLLFNIVIPTLIMLFLLQWFDGFIYSKNSLQQILFSFSIDYEGLFSSILSFNTPLGASFYLWYIFSLVFLYLWTPLLRLFCKDTQEHNNLRRGLMLLAFVSLIIVPTLSAIFPDLWSIHIPSVIPDHYIFYALIGFELRLYWDKHPDFFRKTKTRVLSLSLFIGASLINFWWAIIFDIQVNQRLTSIFYTYNMFLVFVQGVALFSFFLGLSIKKEKVKAMINSVGNKCFYIYLFHMPIILKLQTSSRAIQWQKSLGLSFYPLFIIGIFLICLLLAYIVQYITSFTYRAIKKKS